MPDQRSLLLGRLATAIDGVSDVAARLDPPAAPAVATSPLSAPSARPWTVAAAMEPVAAARAEPVAVSGEQLLLQPSDADLPIEPPAHHRFPALIGAGVIALIVVPAIAVRLLPAAHNTPPPATAQIALTAVRPVASSAAISGVIPPTQISFPAGTATVSIDVNSGGKGGQAPVEMVVTVGQPSQTLIDREYVLNRAGDTLIALTPASGTYAPGNYTVTIRSNGATIGSTAFEVR